MWVVLTTVSTGCEFLRLFRAASKIVCTAPIHTQFSSCKRKLKLMLKRWHVACCVTELTKWGSFTGIPKSRRIHIEHVFTWRPNAHKFLVKMSFHLYFIFFCTLENVNIPYIKTDVFLNTLYEALHYVTFSAPQLLLPFPSSSSSSSPQHRVLKNPQYMSFTHSKRPSFIPIKINR